MADVIISRNAMFLVDKINSKKIEESVQKITVLRIRIIWEDSYFCNEEIETLEKNYYFLIKYKYSTQLQK